MSGDAGPWVVLINDAGGVPFSAEVFDDEKDAQHHASPYVGAWGAEVVTIFRAADAAAAPAMREWVERVCGWLESSAKRDRKKAETCDFESLRDAYLADARNYEKMASDGRKALEGGA